MVCCTQTICGTQSLKTLWQIWELFCLYSGHDLLSNPIQCNWLFIYGGPFSQVFRYLCRISNKLRLMISIRVSLTRHMSSPSQIQESSMSINSLKMLIWQVNIYWLLIHVSQSQLSDKSIHADSMEHLQMCHLNGNNGDKEKGERDNT